MFLPECAFLDVFSKKGKSIVWTPNNSTATYVAFHDVEPFPSMCLDPCLAKVVPGHDPGAQPLTNVGGNGCVHRLPQVVYDDLDPTEARFVRLDHRLQCICR